MALGDKNRSGGKPSAGLLRQALGVSAGPAEACPDAEILAAYADRALDAAETVRYELHFSQCANCREQLAAMNRAAAPVALLSERAPARPFHWVWPWTWFVLAPAATALLFAAVFIGHRSAANRAGEQQPLVAMQAPKESPAPVASPEFDLAPADRVPETPPAKAVAPSGDPRAREAGSIDRTSPDITASVNSDTEKTRVLRAPEQKELTRNSASDLPLQSRNYTRLDKSANAPAATPPPKSAGSAQATDAAGVRATTETVTVESVTAPVTTAAPMPNRVSDAGVAGGNAGEVPTAELAKKEPALTARSSSNLVSVESVADRDARTIVRSPDPQILWRISSGRFVERSSDAGATWRAQWTSVNARVVAGSAPSVDTCWLVGRGGIVLLTTDGKKWRTLDPPASADFVAVDASNAVSATITSTDGRKFETSDAGKHWIPAP